MEGVRKNYGSTQALAGLDLTVAAGTVHGLLGPNGAGKTTAVRILTTLLRPDAGRAEVLGLDVARSAAALRGRIGLTGQYAAVDERLTGLENLEMFGRLYRLPARRARARAMELLERFDLADAARRMSGTYSGGMRRRLDLAASLIIAPPMLFLDEPTTGLDPRGRIGMWEVIGDLVRDGTTVLLTTQYLEEADQLADQISVIDGGRVIAEGTADELKARIGGHQLDIEVARGGDLTAAAGVLAGVGTGEVTVDEQSRRLSVPVPGASVLAEVVRGLDAAGVALVDVALHRPSLDDVFLSLTGRASGAAAHDGGGAASDTPPAQGGGSEPQDLVTT
ncbi:MULTISPECIES: ATP-binding cassette domain-containing protein [unclassified Pseudofrankia]|uniref:ATP-binding cassette domain-containing protein n=1 Tax=unclassified Pseudofrankia TaxID=2994372 RepID=UPI0008DB2C23|nr:MULTISPECIES: ATP-binding cassette domain-containing protein [unclassified Pseudofrankia]MDT3441559.1 ATP-binding cassette domain-containing protein [Pseudofrankia sp. BMG5.37]OHV45603.1 ABC transporter [Pseudofrankia sp. BMG5.36]